jgi:pyruvate dehydrogenase E2 component (dihydrolipoamide acetyltransferase)
MTSPQDVKAAQPTSIAFLGIRKIIAERLTKSHLTAPHVTLMREIDVTFMKRLRERLLTEVKSTRISYTDILVKATTEALKVYRIVNSRLEGDQIKLLDQINIGVAVAQESGLIVPVIRNLERKSLTEISTELVSLVAKANKGALTLNEVTGGTFTITNLGMFGIDAFTPIINPPESAILGAGRILEKPTVIEGRIEARSVMTLSLTFDHRVLDGAVAAQFLGRLAQILEKPEETNFFTA